MHSYKVGTAYCDTKFVNATTINMGTAKATDPGTVCVALDMLLMTM